MLRHGKRDIRIYRTRACIEPGVVGLLRPALLLPVGLEQRLTPSQLEAVLAHELCHIRRRDNLTAAVQMLVEAVFWFHPLIWWLGHRLIDERERACDEMVVALGHDRETYAAGILAVCEHYAATRLACASGISGSDLKRRIVEIMSYHGMRRLKLVKKLLLSAASIAALALPVLAGLVIEQVADAQQNAPDRTAFTEYLPVYKVPPVYPPEAVERRTEGYVVVEFTVTETGSTANVRVVESSDPIFNASAIESASQYRYTPRVTDGATVEVPGVRTRLLYVLDGLDDGPPPEFIQLKTEPLEYLPIVKVAQVYPPRAAAQGIDGFVIVQYTVTTSGNTKDITVIESSNSLFEPAAVQSVRKYKYQPKLIEGRPVEVQGLTTKIEFALND